jgi:hypothetical protein
MKNTFIVLSTLILVGLGACKQKQKAEETPKAEAPKVEVTCAATVEFGSAGGGIDAKKYDEIKLLIEDKKLKYTEKAKGKEGERQICLPLTELSATDKSTFINKLKNAASSGQYVSVSTN